jgi:hypothetical protein
MGACVAPIMIGATAAALQGHPVWGYLVWGFPLALAVATLWTHFRLSTLPAEIRIRPGQVTVRSIQDVLLERSLHWHPLYNVEAGPGELKISVGWNTEICRREDWFDFSQLRETTQQAFEPRARPSSSR